MQEGISIPIRHLSGVLEGVRTGLNALLRKERVNNGRRSRDTDSDYGVTYPPPPPPVPHVRKVDPDPL